MASRLLSASLPIRSSEQHHQSGSFKGKQKSEMDRGDFRGAEACGKGFWISLLLFLCLITTQVKGSIHEYRNEAFTTKSNAFFFHGGSEGLYASKASRHLDSSASSQSGKSFIRFLSFFLFNFLVGWISFYSFVNFTFSYSILCFSFWGPLKLLDLVIIVSNF